LLPGVWSDWDGGWALKGQPDLPVADSSWPKPNGSAQASNALELFNSNYNAIQLISSATPDYVFTNYVRTFSAVNAGTIVSASLPSGPVSAIGQTVHFAMLNPMLAMAQAPFSVEITRYDPSARTIAAKTLPNHPLYGWRYWRVFQPSPGRLVVETGAVDGPADGTSWAQLRNWLGFYLAKRDQTDTWKQYLEHIANDLPGTTVAWDPPYDAALQRGQWGYDKVYIMTHVCGQAPTPSGFCP
jgi:hypothetical protein